MPFHRVHQIGQNGFQPLAAYPVPGFPDDDKSFSNSLIVDTAPISLPGAAATCLPPEQTNRVLSMEPRQLAELIQYLGLLIPRRISIALSQGSYELLSSVLADPVDNRCPPFSVTLC